MLKLPFVSGANADTIWAIIGAKVGVMWPLAEDALHVCDLFHRSYTNFYYYALTVNLQSGNAFVTVSVANEGPMDGDEVRNI